MDEHRKSKISLGKLARDVRRGENKARDIAFEVAPGEVLNVRVVQATAGQLLGLPAA